MPIFENTLVKYLILLLIQFILTTYIFYFPTLGNDLTKLGFTYGYILIIIMLMFLIDYLITPFNKDEIKLAEMKHNLNLNIFLCSLLFTVVLSIYTMDSISNITYIIIFFFYFIATVVTLIKIVYKQNEIENIYNIEIKKYYLNDKSKYYINKAEYLKHIQNLNILLCSLLFAIIILINSYPLNIINEDINLIIFTILVLLATLLLYNIYKIHIKVEKIHIKVEKT